MAEFIPAVERSPEWYEIRRTGVTASEIPVILGLSPESWSSPYALYWQKVGEIDDDRDDEAMAWGRELEAVILRRFTREHPELVVKPGGLYRRTDRPWQMATPDGIAFDETYWWERAGDGTPVAVVQIKTAGNADAWGEPGTDQIPPYYIAQVRWEMDVMGCETAYVPVLFNGRIYREYVVHADAEDAEFMRAEACEFLASVTMRQPPDVDWRTATARTLKALHPEIDPEAPDAEIPATWVRQWQLADRLEAAAKARKRLAQNRILDLIGDGQRATVDGRKVASRSVYDMKERILPATTVRKLHITRKELT